MTQNSQNEPLSQSPEQIAEAERQRAAHLEIVLNSIGDGLTVLDKDGQIILANPVAEQITGRTLSGLNSQQDVARLAQISYLDGTPVVVEDRPANRVIRGESFNDLRFLLTDNENRERIISCSGTPLYIGAHLNGGVILFRDVTEQEHQRQELEHARWAVEKTQEALLELNTAIMGITDLEQLLGRIVQIMPGISGCDRLGITLYNAETDELTPAAVYGLKDEEIAEWRKGVSKRDRTSPYDSYFFEEHKLLEVDYGRLVEEYRAQGQELPNPYNVKNMLILPLAHQGEMLGLITLDHASKYHPFDKREIQLLEAMAQMVAFAIANVRALQKARENAVLWEANRLKDEFMSMVAHELRNPLSSIRGYSQLVKRHLERVGLTGAESQLRNLDRIVEQTVRMNRLVGDLLDLTRIDSGQLQLKPDRHNLADLIQDTIDTFRLDPQSQAHTFNFELASGTEDDRYTGYYDKDRLEQVINNLVSNAIKYSPNGGPITLRLERGTNLGFVPGEVSGYSSATPGQDAEVIHFSITDQGIGIPKEQQELLFERFFRSSNSRASNVPGLGLGLYISNQIIGLHGGRIWAESPGEDQGTTFHFILPYKPTPEDPAAPVNEGTI